MLSHPEFRNALRKIVLFYDSFLYRESDLVSPGLWKILAKYVALFQKVLPFRVLLQERQIFPNKCYRLKGAIIKFSSLLLPAYTLSTFFLLIKEKIGELFTPRESSAYDSLHMRRTFVMFYITLYSTVIPTSVMVAFGAGSLCQVMNQIDQFRARMRGLLHCNINTTA